MFDFTKGKVNKRTNIVYMFYVDQESTSQKVRNKRDSGKFSQIETRFFILFIHLPSYFKFTQFLPV